MGELGHRSLGECVGNNWGKIAFALGVGAIVLAPQALQGTEPTATAVTVECPSGLVPTTPNGPPFSGITYIACRDGHENYYNPKKVNTSRNLFLFNNPQTRSGVKVMTYAATCVDNYNTDNDNKFPAPKLINYSVAPDPNEPMGLHYKVLCERGSTPRLVPIESQS